MASSSPTPKLPALSTLPTAPLETLHSLLDVLFEPAPEIHDLAVPSLRQQQQQQQPPQPFATYRDLILHVGGLMSQLCDHHHPQNNDDTTGKKKRALLLHGILGSHPRLGAAKVTSAQSAAEQAKLQQASAEEAAQLAALNAEYEARFPGLRYVVFVNGQGRPEIMADMRRRIDRGDMAAEEREGVRAMVDIALDRAGKLEVADA